MRIVHHLKDIAPSDRRSVVAIGMFDGVHKGHRRIIKTAVKKAKEREAQSVVLTFDRHPLEVIKPGSHPSLLTSPALKARLIELLGVDLLVVLPFTKKFSQLNPKQFLNKISENLKIEQIVVGENFRFGKGAAGDVTFLKEYGQSHGFEVKSLGLVKADGESISSTRIRHLLKEGNLPVVKSFLGHFPIVTGRVVSGAGRGGFLGFHTANVETPDWASLPGKGVYAGFIRIEGSRKRKCAISIGTAPTFSEKKRRLEAHIIGFKRDIYGKQVELEVRARIRDEKKFEDARTLARQIARDIKAVKKFKM